MQKYMKKTRYSLSQAKRDLPTRKRQDNKTRGGKCLVIAGSRGMWGAAILSATAAARCGAGYVYLKTTGQGFPLHRHPDFLQTTSVQPDRYQALAIGPGLKAGRSLKSLLRKLGRTCQIPVVIDASALTALAQISLSFFLPANWVLTPHEGEMARLLGVSSDAIRRDRQRAVIQAQKKYGCVVLLKGSPTLISDGRRLIEIKSGNPALAKAGTGDVLTGMILAFLGQGLSSVSAAALASFVHGRMADHWLKEGKDILSLMASDLLERVPETLVGIRRQES